MSGCVLGGLSIESIKTSVPILLQQYMDVTVRIEDNSAKLEKLQKDYKEKTIAHDSIEEHEEIEIKDEIKNLQEQVESLSLEREQLRLHFDERLDQLETSVVNVKDTAEAAKKISFDTTGDFKTYKTELSRELAELTQREEEDIKTLKDTIAEKEHQLQSLMLQVEESTSEKVQALESCNDELQQMIKELVEKFEKEKKSHVKEIASLKTAVNTMRYHQLTEEFEGSFTELNTQNSHRKYSLPTTLMSSENSVSKSLPPLTTRRHQRHTSESSSDSGYSHTSITTPDKEKRFELGNLDLHSHSRMKR